MEGKETTKKVWMKIGFGILFVAVCFIAMYILTEFHGDILVVSIAAVLLLISAFLFMNAVFSDKAKQRIPKEEQEDEKEVLSSGGDGEFRLKITKHMKEMESTQKELIDVLKNQNTLLKNQIDNLEHEIYMLSEKQANQTKSVIKFNKENARQLAISERETLEYVMLELKKAIEDNAGSVVVRETPVDAATAENVMAAAPVEELVEAASVLEEVSEAEFFEVSDLAGDEEVTIPDLPMAEEIEIPDMPEDIDVSELFDIPELLDEPAEETPVEEAPIEELPVPEVVEEAVSVAEEPAPAPAADPLAGRTGDPNAMMTPEDIAKLLASMGQ